MILECRHVKKTYPFIGTGHSGGQPRMIVLDDVNLSITDGDCMALVGESGCGKTTLARILLRLVAADSGEIDFCGNPWLSLSGRALAKARRQMAVVFQDPFNSLDPRMVIKDVVAEPLLLTPMTKKQQRDRVVFLLHSVGLKEDILTRYPHEFSGGERQRIALARALACSPKLLILDEAVSSLDVLVQARILDLLRKIQLEFQLTYLFISHNLKVVSKVCSQVAVMDQGKIVEVLPAQDLLSLGRHAITQKLVLAAKEYTVISSAS